MQVCSRVLSLIGVLVLLSTVTFAQLDRGSLSGTITDANGAILTGAKITAKNDRTGVPLETVTTNTGLYVFPNLDPGTYTLTIEQSGFKKLTRSNVVIAIGNRSVVDIQLEVGDVSQTVTVTDTAPQLNTATTEVGVSFAPKLFNDAPISAGGLRNIEAFIGLQPGVTNGAGGEGGISGGARRSKEILLDGANMTNPESGGVAFNGLPAYESIGEFRLINNTFAAEYGRTGGGIESFVTKSGGNQFHGNAFDFHTSSALNAASWAGKASSTAANPVFRKTPFHGNNYGFTIGGPVYLPKKIFGPIGGYNEDKSKTFFLFTSDDFRRASASSSFITLPTVKMRSGDFSEYLPNKIIYDPITKLAFAGNIIPQNRFSTVSKNILALIPQPTNGNLTQNYLQTTTSVNKQDSWSLKINHNIGTRHLISGYYSSQYIGSVITGPLPGPLFGNGSNAFSPNKPIFARFGYDWIMSPTMNLHVSYGITKLRAYFENPSVGQGWPQRLGLTGVQTSGTDAFPVVTFAGVYQALADTNGTKTNGTQFNNTDHLRADLSWIRGNFNWKFGFDKRWMRTTGEPLPSGAFDDAGVQGVFNFSSVETANNGGGDPFASFLLGAVNNSSRTFNGTGITAKFGYNAMYAQTDWRIRPNLTINLGFRYEIPIPRQTNPIGSFTSFDPTITDPRSGLKGALSFLGNCQGCNGQDRFGKIDYTSYGPRLGFAWSADQKTVVRVGYGIYYAAGNGLMGGFCLRCATGFATVASGVAGATTNWDTGFTPNANFIPPGVVNPSAGNAADDIYYINPKSGVAPRFQNWSIGIQRELPFKFVAEAAYIGNRGSRLSANHFSLNLLDPKYYALGSLLFKYIDDPAVVAAGFKSPYPNFIADWGKSSTTTGATLARALRPYPQINGPIDDEYNPVGSSWYDSLQLKLDRRFGALYVEANYTWSKSLTNASGSQTGGDSNNRNPKTDRSISTLGQDGVLAFEKSLQYTDYPFIMNVVASYDLPFGKGKKFLSNNGIVDRVFGGWTVSFVGQYTSGALILLNAPLDYPNWGFAYGRKRVNIVPGKAIQTGVSRQDLDPRNPNIRWLNNDFYTIPGQFELGNSPTYLTQLRNPNFYSENMGFIKRTRITETVNFEMRAEFFNIFNRTNFGFPGTPFRPTPQTTSTFGIPTGPRSGERSGQIMARINF